MKRYKFFVCIIAIFLAFSKIQTSYAAFEQDMSLPSIVLCEVRCYGEKSLRQEFFYTFEELLQEKFYASKKVRVENKLMIDPVLDDGTTLKLDDFFQQIHMNAIVNGKEFDRDSSCVQLMNYYDSLPEISKRDKSIYRLNYDLREKLKYLGNLHGADYMLFVNLKAVDVIIKNHYTGINFQDLKGMKLKLDMDYYLVNSKTGMVFEGTSFTDKTTQVINIILAKYGKTFTVQQLLHTLLEVQAERAAKDVIETGLKRLKEID